MSNVNIAMVASICNLSSLYYLSKGIRINTIKTSSNIIKDICDNNYKITTQYSYLNQCTCYAEEEHPMIMSNMLYSGCEFVTSRYLAKLIDNPTEVRIINYAITSPNYVYTARVPDLYNTPFKEDVLVEGNKELMLLDTYVVLNNIKDIKHQLETITGINSNKIEKICLNEIKYFENNIINKPDDILQCDIFKQTVNLYTDEIKEYNTVFKYRKELDNIIK